LRTTLDGQESGTSTPLRAVRPSIFLMTNTLEVGGSERQFVELTGALNRQLFDVQPACLRRTGGLVFRVGEIPEFPPGGSLFRLQAQKARLAMVRFMREKKTQVAHAFDFYTNIMLAPAARFAGVPVIIGGHRQIGDLLSPAQFRVQAMAFRFCDRVICNSQAAATRLREAGIADKKLVVIPNGLPAALFSEVAPAIPKRAGWVRIGMVARMNDPVKNHSAFLRAAARLSAACSTVEFLMVGDGSLRPSLEKLAGDLGIAERVTFTGERHDIPAILASLDISVLVSGSESLSNVVLESMATGLPVVANRVGGNPELIRPGETGDLVEPGNEEQLTTSLLRLVRNPSLRLSYGANGRAFARSQFHITQIATRYEQLYSSLLEEKR
jgi:L-malate glycosyltransferase